MIRSGPFGYTPYELGEEAIRGDPGTGGILRGQPPALPYIAETPPISSSPVGPTGGRRWGDALDVVGGAMRDIGSSGQTDYLQSAISRANAARPGGQAPSTGGHKWADRLAILGGALRDMGAGGQADHLQSVLDNQQAERDAQRAAADEQARRQEAMARLNEEIAAVTNWQPRVVTFGPPGQQNALYGDDGRQEQYGQGLAEPDEWRIPRPWQPAR